MGHSYKVEVTPSGGGAPTDVVTDLVLTRFDGTTFTHTANVVTGRFTYLPFTENVNSVLAQWDTAGDAKWVVKLSTFDGGGSLVGTDTHLIQLDNTWPGCVDHDHDRHRRLREIPDRHGAFGDLRRARRLSREL